MRRREFTRSEIFGRIGMLPRPGKEFNILYLKNLDSLVQINNIFAGKGLNEFEIPCSIEEIMQFPQHEQYQELYEKYQSKQLRSGGKLKELGNDPDVLD
jgi:hypothetical protein